jgi:hypothetical protein
MTRFRNELLLTPFQRVREEILAIDSIVVNPLPSTPDDAKSNGVSVVWSRR